MELVEYLLKDRIAFSPRVVESMSRDLVIAVIGKQTSLSVQLIRPIKVR
jgi:hypothetical protein